MKDNQRIALTRRLLREGLLRLMERKPLDKISVSELCGESGINRATFYRHYGTPRDVLDDMERELISGLEIDVCKISDVRDIVHCFEIAMEYLYSHADMLKILLQNRSDEELTQMINEMCAQVFSLKSRLSIAGDLDMDAVKLISAYSVGGVYFLLRQWLLGDIQKTPQEISRLIQLMLSLGGNSDA